MNVLLDTHTFLWWIDDDARLSPRAREIVDVPILTADPHIARYSTQVIW